MNDKLKDIADAVVTHPKTSTAIVAGVTNFNVWFAHYEPVIKFATSMMGLVLVSVLIVKHVIDIRRELKK